MDGPCASELSTLDAGAETLSLALCITKLSVGVQKGSFSTPDQAKGRFPVSLTYNEEEFK
jgi:hypothetical protein